MKIFAVFLVSLVTSCHASSKKPAYHGSTPADQDVRAFLGISLTDSIDFIRWNLIVYPNRYELDCRYGLSKANTNGFTNEKKAAFSGTLSKQGNTYQLHHSGKVLFIVEINSSLLHLANQQQQLMVGNGGFSYALNNKTPARSAQFNYEGKRSGSSHVMAFQGRTPCREIAAELGRANDVCYKKKWYIVFFTDSLTGRPAYFLEGGRQYKRSTMAKGSWEILQKNGRTIYKLQIDTRPLPLYLLKADDNILFFTDANGILLVGDEDFSYILNRTDREPK